MCVLVYVRMCVCVSLSPPVCIICTRIYVRTYTYIHTALSAGGSEPGISGGLHHTNTAAPLLRALPQSPRQQRWGGGRGGGGGARGMWLLAQMALFLDARASGTQEVQSGGGGGRSSEAAAVGVSAEVCGSMVLGLVDKVCVCVRVFVRVCVCMHTQTHTDTQMRVHTHTHTRARAHTHTHTQFAEQAARDVQQQHGQGAPRRVRLSPWLLLTLSSVPHLPAASAANAGASPVSATSTPPPADESDAESSYCNRQRLQVNHIFLCI